MAISAVGEAPAPVEAALYGLASLAMSIMERKLAVGVITQEGPLLSFLGFQIIS